MQDALEEVHIRKVLGPTHDGTAVVLGNDKKSFVIFIGRYEGAAINRELEAEVPPRPLTHDLMAYILDGFNIDVKKIIISDVVNETFCATLVLEQRVLDKGGEWVGKRNEVRIDARPSDCMILALKEKKPLFCTQKVLATVTDVSNELADGLAFEGGPGGDDEPKLF